MPPVSSSEIADRCIPGLPMPLEVKRHCSALVTIVPLQLASAYGNVARIFVDSKRKGSKSKLRNFRSVS